MQSWEYFLKIVILSKAKDRIPFAGAGGVF
jgi:hypothetical protein